MQPLRGYTQHPTHTPYCCVIKTNTNTTKAITPSAPSSTTTPQQHVHIHQKQCHHHKTKSPTINDTYAPPSSATSKKVTTSALSLLKKKGQKEEQNQWDGISGRISQNNVSWFRIQTVVLLDVYINSIPPCLGLENGINSGVSFLFPPGFVLRGTPAPAKNIAHNHASTPPTTTTPTTPTPVQKAPQPHHTRRRKAQNKSSPPNLDVQTRVLAHGVQLFHGNLQKRLRQALLQQKQRTTAQQKRRVTYVARASLSPQSLSLQTRTRSSVRASLCQSCFIWSSTSISTASAALMI